MDRSHPKCEGSRLQCAILISPVAILLEEKRVYLRSVSVVSNLSSHTTPQVRIFNNCDEIKKVVLSYPILLVSSYAMYSVYFRVWCISKLVHKITTISRQKWSMKFKEISHFEQLFEHNHFPIDLLLFHYSCKVFLPQMWFTVGATYNKVLCLKLLIKQDWIFCALYRGNRLTKISGGGLRVVTLCKAISKINPACMLFPWLLWFQYYDLVATKPCLAHH